MAGGLAALGPTPAAQAATPPTPAVSVSAPGAVTLGSDFSFMASFVNGSPDETGYGPFIDLVFPTTGVDGAGVEIDDGVDFLSATYLGQAVTAVTLTFPGPDPIGCVDHPYAVALGTGAPLEVCGPAGDTLVVLQLPFGSFTPGQPAAVVAVNAHLSDLADVDTALNIHYRGGFQFGATPTNDWCCSDATILSHTNTDPATWPGQPVTPTLLAVTKSANAPEGETATGPNYPRRYTVRVDVADGQTLTDLLITDTLPSNVQFVALVSATPTSTVVLTPTTATPGGSLVVQFPSVTGGPGAADAALTFEFFVPRLDAGGGNVIDPATADDAASVNAAQASGTWTPLDVRDTPAVATATCPNCHSLADKALTLQKGVTNLSAPNTPGDVLEYTLDFQVSDYFAFGSVVITDTFSDGQRFDATFTPTLALNGNGYTFTVAPLAAANFTVDVSEIAGDPDPATDGSTTVVFRLTAEAVTRGQLARFVGGCIDPAAGSNPPDCSLNNDGPTTGRLKFRTVIQQTFSDTYPSGDPSVDHGDILTNAATVGGDVLNPATFAPTGSGEADGSGTSLSIAFGTLQKTIYAVNGSVCPGDVCSNVRISPGETVTYRLRYTQPASDFEATTLTDFLPLPIFSAPSVMTYTNAICGVPAPGTVCLGPADTYHDLDVRVPGSPTPVVPVMTTYPVSNTVVFAYADYDNPFDVSSEIDLLLTVQASNAPFADKLFLTNQANVTEGTTNAGSQVVNAIVQVELTQPALINKKAAVATDNPNALFLPDPTGPVTFTAPGSAGPRWSGVINSTNLLASPIDSDVTGLDAGDRVTFALVVENTGTSSQGAFDIVISDTLVPGFVVPPSGLNLRVAYGDSAAVPPSYTRPDGSAAAPADLFSGGIKLVDPGLGAGACQAHSLTNGLNIIVITYDLQLGPDVNPDQVLVNTSTLANYAGSEGGPNHVPGGRTDTATATVKSAGLVKTLSGTNQAHTSGTNVAIGEVLTYTVQLTVPEGVWPSVLITDTLDAGLAFLDAVTITAPAALTSTVPFASLGNPVVAVGGGSVTFDLGALFNADRDDTVTETVDVVYRAVVLNTAGNVTNTQLNNLAQVSGVLTPTNAVNVTVVQPTLALSKAVAPVTGDAGNPITYTLRVTNTGTLDAFNIVVTDVLPSNVSVVTAAITSGVAPSSLITTTGALTVTWDSLTAAQSAVVQLATALNGTVTPNQAITNTANLQWTSLPGDVTAPQSVHNALSVERTGDTGGPGGAANTYKAAATATLTTTTTSLAKIIVGTDRAHTSGNTVAIGELITYTVLITVPEGVTPSALFTDTLDAGLAFVSLDAVSASAALTTSVPGGFAAIQAAAVVTNNGAGAANQGRDLRLNFGTLTNSDTDNAVAETLQLTYTVGVLNTTGSPNNVAGQQRNNAVTYTWPGNSRTASAPNVTLAEPAFTLSKTAAPTSGQAGDVITFTVTATNTGGALAFEAVLTDVVPAYMTYVNGSLAGAGAAPPDTLVEAGGTLTTTWNSLATGAAGSFTFQATLNANVVSGQVITNTAYLQWTSLPGSVGTSLSPHNTLVVERTGNTADTGGNANTYRANASRAVSVILHQPTKSIVATSEAATAASDRAVVGEIVRYRMQVLLANGSSPSFQLRDTLPVSVTYLNDGSTLVGLVSPTGTELTSDDAGLAGAQLAQGATITTTAPVFTLPSANITGTATVPVFSLGNLTASADTTPKYVVLEFNALVGNGASVQAGTNLTNTFTVRISGADLSTSNVVTTTVSEPALAVSKTRGTPAPVDAGDLITYTVRITNTGGANGTTAFDVVLTDTLNSILNFVGLTHSEPGGAAFGSSVAGQTLTATLSQLAPGETALITVTATLRDTATPAQTFGNTATVAWTSLPGTGTTPNSTNSTTPGASGAADGERTGTGGVNDYTAASTVNTTLGGPALAKALTGTSNADTAGSDVAVGEVLTYTLAVTLPEGTAASLVVTDTLPAGLAYVAGSGALDASGYNGTLDPADPVVSVAGQNVVFTFSHPITTTADNVAGNNAFALRLQAIVTNVAGNQWNISLANNANLRTGSATATAGAVTARIVEPALTITKTILSLPSPADAGGLVIYRIGLTNTTGITASAAYDVVLSDTLPSALALLTPLTVTHSAGGAYTDTSTSNLVNVAVARLLPGEGVVVDYAAVIQDSVTPAQIIANAAEARYTSQPGPDANERTGTGGVDDYRAGPVTQSFTTAGLALAKVLEATSAAHTVGSSVAIGEVLTYTLAVTLPEGTTPGLVVTDTLPAGLDFITGTVDAASFNGVLPAPMVSAPGSSPATFTFGATTVVSDNVAANNSFTLRVVARVRNVIGNQDAGALANTASAQVTGGTPVSAGPVTATVVEPVLALAKSASTTAPTLGQTLSFTLTLTHAVASTAEAFDVVITDTLPAGLDFVAGSGVITPTGTFDESGAPVLVVRVPGLARGDSVVVLYQATVAAANPVGAVLTNTATLAWTSLPSVDAGERDGSGGVNDYTAPASSAVTVSNIDLQIAKTDGVAAAAPGAVLTYTLTVTNAGNVTASGVTVTDTLPGNVAFLSASDGGGEVGGVVAWPTFSLAGGAAVTRTVTVQVANPLPAGALALTNTAGVSDSGGHGPEPTPGDNTATDTDTLNAAPDLQLTKTDGLAMAAPGQVLTYTLTITNAGNRGATGVSVTDTLPAHVAFLSASNSGAEAGGVVTWPGFSLGGGGLTVTRTVTVRVADPLPAGVFSITNAAAVTDDGANGPEPTPGDNAGADTTVLVPVVDLVITKRETSAAVPGGVLTYTLVYTNVGSIAATGVAITETVPFSTTFNAAASGAAWSCADGAPAGTVCGLTIGSVSGGGGGGSTTFALTVTTPIAAGVDVITNTVVIGDDGAGGADLTPADNVYTRTTPLDAGPDLQVHIGNGGVTTVQPGDTLTYTLTYTNAGNQDTTGTLITVTVPVNTVFLPGSSAPGWTCVPDNTAGSLCTYVIGTLVVGGGGQFTYTVQLADPWPIGGSPGVTIVAHITDDGHNGADPTPNNNVSNSATTPTAVTLLYFGVEAVTDSQVTLGWATATEVDHLGFWLYRAAVNDFAQAQTLTFLPAAMPGGSLDGGLYAYTDTPPGAGTWWYWLVDVGTDGVVTRHPVAGTSALVGPAGAPYGVFLPVIQR